MIGIIIQLAISWLLIWSFEKGNLKPLGLFPTTSRLRDFLLFFFITAACSASDYFLRMLLAKQSWMVNPNINMMLLAKGIWWNVKSVLFEELIFRGALLYILIKRIGASKAILLSAIAFGMYHWFSHETWGDVKQMAITFITTGSMGVVYAYGYAKTFSLYIPVAIHLGWNIVRSVVFSETVIGEQWLVQVKPVPVVTISWVAYFFWLLIPILSALLINFFIIKQKRQQE